MQEPVTTITPSKFDEVSDTVTKGRGPMKERATPRNRSSIASINSSAAPSNDSGLPDIKQIFGSQKGTKKGKDEKTKVPNSNKLAKAITPPTNDKINEGKGNGEKAKLSEDDNQNPSPEERPNSARVRTPEARGENDTKFTECPFSDFGCTMTGEAIQVRRHIRDESSLHLSQMCAVVIDMSEASKKALQKTTELNEESEKIVHRVMQVTNLYSSQFLWRITNYSEAYANARRGQPPIIYSPPFCSHRQGYKLAAAIGLYGDGDAIGECNSVFITILRGEHDPVLPWPFRCPIKFTLINLKGGKNVEATITPRVTGNNMPFLGRPTSDRNPAFGLKNFADLRMMTESNGFVNNNSCFLRIEIDLEPVYCQIH